MNTNYQILLNILEHCYNICKEDDLGGLLGCMSTDVFSDGIPVDCAVYEDWCQIASNEKNIFENAIIFLTIYEERYGFKFIKTKNNLEKFTAHD